MKDPDKRKIALNFDSYVALASILIALFLIHDEYRMPTPSIQQTLGPSFVPIAVLVALILAAILLFFSSLGMRQKTGGAPVRAEQAAKTSAVQYKVMGMVVLGLLLYAFILVPAGFIVSTAILIVWQARLFQKGKWVRNLIVGILFSVIFYYIFVHVLEVMLPRGFLPW